MPKEYYEHIAWIIKNQKDDNYICDSATYRIAEMLSNFFENQDANFNRDRFIKECGITD